MEFLQRLLGRSRPDPVAWIEPEDLDRMQRAGAAPMVVDVRGPDEFAGPLGHIPGALNMPLGELDGRIGELRGRPAAGIALVCHTDRRSAAAHHRLKAAGFADTAVLRGGMQRWNAVGLQTTRGKADRGPVA